MSRLSWGWLGRKVLTALVTLVFVLVFNFFLFRVMGDPTSQLAHVPGATPAATAKLKHNLGLDKSVPGQFVEYVKDTATLDLGTGYRSREPVLTSIGDALPWTLLLVGVGTVIAMLAGTWMGVRAAVNRGKRTDDGLMGFSLFTYAAPEYWIGIILILAFAVGLPWFPAGQEQTPGVEFSSWFSHWQDVAAHLVLPAITMALLLLGQYFLIMRSSMVDVMTEDFITVKRATGLSREAVISRHAVPNALLPLITVSAINFGSVFGGAITIETIFSWPGLGELNYQAIQDKDFPVLQGTFLLFSVAVILFNLIADALYFVLDPRVQDR